MEHTSFEAVVMIGVFDGMNMEDAVVVKRSSLERGMGHLTAYKTYTDEINSRGGNEEEYFCLVNNCAAMKNADYSKIEADGAPMIGAKIAEGDVVIGKISQTLQVAPNGRHLPLSLCRSTLAKEDCIVDAVMWTVTAEGKKQLKVRVRTTRRTQVGDKYASRHAQKGTVGLIVNDADMPFNEHGMSPDMIINPHAFVSRMTIGMIIEMLCGKAASFDGKFVDARPFDSKADEKMKHAAEVLRKNGFNGDGEEMFKDGRTGRLIRRPIMQGIVSIQALRHLVDEKWHARRTGRRHILTAQPMEGRGRGGGLRMGEMERDGLIAHGVSEVIRDRFMSCSDGFKATICRRCGVLAEQAHSASFATGMRGGRAYCSLCADSSYVSTVEIPYAAKLLVQELFGLGISLKMTPNNPTSE